MKALSELDWTLIANVEMEKKKNASLNVHHINPHFNNP